MNAHLGDLIDGSHQFCSRRSGSGSSTGLDYSTSCRCEEDLIWGTQALLESGQKYLTSHPPWTANILIEGHYEVARFDFTSARSVAKVARLGSELGRPSLPLKGTLIPIPMESSQKLSRRLTSRRSFSLTELRGPERLLCSVSAGNRSSILDVTRAHDTLLTCCPSEEGKPSHSSPRLVLQDKIPPRRSSVAKTPRTDLFDNTEKRRQSVSQLTVVRKQSERSTYDFMSREQVLKPHAPLVQVVRVQSPLLVSRCPELQTSKHIERDLRSSSTHIPGSYQGDIFHDSTYDGEASPPPVTIHPMLRGQNSETLTCLPSPAIQPASSIHSNTQDLSQLTGGSRSSSHRHALLKPSVSGLQPLDLGLPIQPILTSGQLAFSDAKGLEFFSHSPDGLTRHSHDSLTMAPHIALAGALQILQTGEQEPQPVQPAMVDCCENGGQQVTGSPDTIEPIAIAHRKKDDQEDISVQTMAKESCKDDELEVVDTAMILQDIGGNSLGLAMAPEIAEYWGFHHNLKESVEAAVKTAVRKVVHHAVLPPESSHHEASRAYRRLIAESLAEAARTADQYLERSSVWNSQTSLDSRIPSPRVSHDLEAVSLEVDENVVVSKVQEDDVLIAPGISGKPSGIALPQKSVGDTESELRGAVTLTPEKPNQGQQRSRSLSISQPTSPQLIVFESASRRKSQYYDCNRRHTGGRWLRDLISKRDEAELEAYIPKLTSLPARSHRDTLKHPTKNHPRETAADGHYHHAAVLKQYDHGVDSQSEAFTKTIDDLEHLLNEALYIARETVEKTQYHAFPRLLENAAAVLHSGRGQFWQGQNKSNSAKSDVQSKILTARESLESSISSSSSAGLHPNGYLPYQHTRSGPVKTLDKQLSLHIKATQVVPIPVTTEADDPEKIQNNPIPNDLAHSQAGAGTILLHPLQKDSIAGLIGQQRPLKPCSDDSNVSPKNFANIKKSDAVPFVGNNPSEILVNRPQVSKPTKREAREFIRAFHHPLIEPRTTSLALRKDSRNSHQERPIVTGAESVHTSIVNDNCTLISRHSLDGPQETESEIDFTTPHGIINHLGILGKDASERYELNDSGTGQRSPSHEHGHGTRRRLHRHRHKFSLRGRHHVSIDHQHVFSLSRSHKRQPIARDWSPMRKRFVATVACISTALIGILIGIYAGEVPSIQYYIVDFHHYAIMGNVFMYIGLAISTLFCWPLPLLHGRKPYILGAMTIAMPLLFPQAIMVHTQRSPYTSLYRVGLILPRAFMGFILGFANVNTIATLMDLFGASLQSGNPHQEVVDKFDVRRHGGGMGIWLGIWTWCYMGSIGVGFLIGAWIINTLSPDWGFYVSIVIIAAVLLLNIITPEVRRNAWRRSVAEVRNGSDVSRRLAKGEVMMHRLQTGPKWWGEELHQGVMLSCDMVRQPGFLFMALYVAWIYGQIVLVIILLGSLMSKYYHFISPIVGVTTLSIPIGAMLAIPFQKASIFSRARHHPQRTDSMTFERRVTRTSHLLRRAIFTLVLPFAGLAYTLSSGGPPTPFILPILFAGLIGFLSNLAIAECNGIIMEAFDTSDLQPGMTGRPRGASGKQTRHKRTNYSSFPRVSSAFSIIQSLGFLIAAAATGVGGVAQRHLGQQAATSVMAGILLILTVGVLVVLIRWKDVQIIPSSRTIDMENWNRARKESALAASGKSVQSPTSIELNHRPHNSGPADTIPAVEEESWRPVIIGNPSGKMRRMSILELGAMSRWSEIRRRNRLVDEGGYEARHPNLAVVESVRERVREGNLGSLRKGKRGNRSRNTEGSSATGSET